MAGLYFTVGADFQKLQKLKRDIDDLKAKLRGMDQAADPKEFARLEKQLARLSREFDREAVAAQRAGAMTARAGREASAAATDFGRFQNILMKIGGTTALVGLGKQIIDVRNQFQQLEIAFGTMLKSTEKASALMKDLTKFAAETPFGLQSAASGAKQLLAYGSTADTVIKELTMLGDVAAGTGQQIGDLVYLYGTLRTQGRAYLMDIRQFAGRGIPIYDELAKVLNTSKDKVNEFVSAGKVGFKEVEQAFRNMTAQGGLYGGLMEEQSKSIGGRIEALKDNIDSIFNSIGKDSEGIIYKSIDGLNTLVENYETIGKILVGLIATYGLYKAAIITTNAIKPVQMAKTYEAQAAALSKLLTGEQVHKISQLGLVQGSAEHVAAIRAEITATAESAKAKLQEEQINLQTLRTKRAEAEQTWMTARAKTEAAKQELASAIATAQAEAEASLQKKMAIESEKQSRAALRIVKLQEQKDAAIAQATALKEKNASAEKIAAKNKEIASIQAKIAAARQEEIQHGRNVAAMRAEIKAGVNYLANKNVQTLSNKVNTLSEKENAAATVHSGYIKQMVGSKVLIKKLATQADTAATVQNTAATVANTTATGALAATKTRLWGATKNLFSVLVPNPYILATAAIVAMGYGIYKLATYTTAAEKAINQFNEEAGKEVIQLNGVFNAYKRANEGTEEKKKLLDIIKTKYGEYIRSLIDEKGRIIDIEAAQRLANKALKESIALKIRDAAISDITTKEIKKQAESLGGLRSVLAKTDGDEAANHIISKVGQIFSDENKSAKQAALEAQQYLENQGIQLNETAGLFGKSVGNYLNELMSSSQTIKNEKRNIENSFKGLIEGDPINIYVPEGKEAAKPTYADDYKKAKEEWEAAKKELAKIEKDKDKFTTEQYTAAKQREKNAKDSFEAVGGKTKTDKSAESAAEKARKSAQKDADERLKLYNDREKVDLDAYNAELENQQKQIDLLQDGFDKRRKQLSLNFDKEILTINKRVQELIQKQQEAERKQWDIDNPNGAKTPFTPTTKSMDDLFKVNPQIEQEITQSFVLARKAYNQGTADLLKSVLEQYQDFNTKRIELEKKYNEDLKFLEESRTEENKEKVDATIAQLKKQFKESMSTLNLEELQDNIDWSIVFGDLSRLSTDALESVRNKLQEYLKSSAGKMTKEDLKTLTDAIEQMNSVIADRSPLTEIKTGYAEYKEAVLEVAAAKEKLNGLEEGTEGHTAAVNELAAAEKKRRDSLLKMTKATNSIGKAGSQLVNSGKEIVDMLGDFGVSVDETVSKTLEGVGKIMSGLESIDISNPFSIITGSISVLTGLGSTIAGIFGGKNEISQAVFDRYESMMSLLDSIIARQKEILSSSAGSAAVNDTKEAISVIEKQINATKKLGLDFLNSGSGAGSHSYGRRQYDRLKKHRNEINKLGLDFDSWGDRITGIYNLTSDELILLQTKLPEAWNELNEETKGFLQTIIDSGENLEELQTQLNEILTGITFDSAKDSLKNFLTDADTTFESVAENFEGYMRDAISNIIIDSLLSDQIQNWYQNFANAMKDDALSDKELSSLRDEYLSIYENARKQYESALSAAGLDTAGSSSQQASKGVYQGMSQDTGDRLEARNTAIHMEIIKTGNNIITMSADVRNMTTQMIRVGELTEQSLHHMEEIKTIQLNSYYELKDINNNTKELYQMNERIGEMNDKLSRL